MNLGEITNEILLEEIQKRFLDRDLIIADSAKMLKKLEDVNKRLTKSEENRSKFMSIIKNEFNNPIFSMISLSKSLLKASDDERVSFIGESLYEESLMLNFQIKNIITAAEIESGTIGLESSKIDFLDILLQIKEELKYPLQHKKIDLQTKISTEDIIYLDREKLYLILLNLISNAVEFSPSGSKVNVFITEENNDIKLIVQDFGEGIDESDYENIFKRFHQAHSGMNRAHRGQGLGLSIVRDLVDLLDGSIHFESTLLKSTKFEVTLAKSLKSDNNLFDDDDFLFVSDSAGEEF
jgi:signal transduction histidine kinase